MQLRLKPTQSSKWCSALIGLLALATTACAQIRSVSVGTNGAVVAPSNFWPSNSLAIQGSGVMREPFLVATTTNNTQTELLIEKTGARMVIPTNSAWVFDILLEAWSATDPSFSNVNKEFVGAWKITGAIVNIDGTVALGKNWNSTNSSYSTNGKYDASKARSPTVTTTILAGDVSGAFGAPVADADDTNKSLRLQVTATGYESTTFKWAARVRMEQITYTP